MTELYSQVTIFCLLCGAATAIAETKKQKACFIIAPVIAIALTIYLSVQ